MISDPSRMPLPAPWHTTNPTPTVLTEIWTPSDVSALWEARNKLDDPVGCRYGSSSASASDSASGSELEVGITFQYGYLQKRPRKATQSYAPTTQLTSLQNDRVVSSGHPPAYIAERTKNDLSTNPKPEMISRKRKKRVVREGTCCNCGCGQSETTLWRTNPLDRDSGAGKLKGQSLLCNACGIWTVTHGTPRPSRFWDTKRRLVEQNLEASQAEEQASRARREEEACRRRLAKAERARAAAEQDLQRQQSRSHRRELEEVECAAAREMDLLQAAEALLGLRVMKGEIGQPSHEETPATFKLTKSTPPQPLSPSSHSQVYPPSLPPRNHNLRDFHLAWLFNRPKKNRRAVSPSVYVRSASVGCTTLLPSAQRRRPAMPIRNSAPTLMRSIPKSRGSASGAALTSLASSSDESSLASPPILRLGAAMNGLNEVTVALQ